MSDYTPDFHPQKTLFQVGVKAVIENPQNHKILILTRSEKVSCRGCADLPGGNLENFESPQEGIEREIFEETGLTCRNFRLVQVTTLNHKNQPLLLIGFHCLADKTEVSLDWESSSYDWMTRTEALNLDLSDGQKDIIKKSLPE